MNYHILGALGCFQLVKALNIRVLSGTPILKGLICRRKGYFRVKLIISLILLVGQEFRLLYGCSSHVIRKHAYSYRCTA